MGQRIAHPPPEGHLPEAGLIQPLGKRNPLIQRVINLLRQLLPVHSRSNSKFNRRLRASQFPDPNMTQCDPPSHL